MRSWTLASQAHRAGQSNLGIDPSTASHHCTDKRATSFYIHFSPYSTDGVPTHGDFSLSFAQILPLKLKRLSSIQAQQLLCKMTVKIVVCSRLTFLGSEVVYLALIPQPAVMYC